MQSGVDDRLGRGIANYHTNDSLHSSLRRGGIHPEKRRRQKLAEHRQHPALGIAGHVMDVAADFPVTDMTVLILEAQHDIV